MTCSEARLAANRQNSALSSGPSASGRSISRRNSLVHGLTGKGVVLPEADRQEVARRAEALAEDMKPRSPAGSVLILQMAMLSVRAERAAERELAAIARHVRHAADAFDEERVDRANALFEALREDPRGNLRKLRKMPEGVERLIEEWQDLRADLATEPELAWTASHLERAALMLGVKPEHARGSRLGALARATWGDFLALAEHEGGHLGVEARRAWARAALSDHIDAEVAALEAHYETLDFETIALDRAEAGQRALFDPSKEATLARRYESEARRGFFKALKEFRQVEAESEARAESSSPPPRPAPVEPAVASSREMPPPAVGSSRETAPPSVRDPVREFVEQNFTPRSVVRGPDGRPLRIIPLVNSPG